MPSTLFISDLHLCAERPHINRLFFDFVARIAVGAGALYILGDLFEYWVGDDDAGDELNARVAESLKALGQHGVAVFLMQGNRDVLLGAGYAARCDATLVSDPTLLDICGARTLIMHGDTLCTDDIEYQKFRAYARDPQNQQNFLSQPLADRHLQIRAMRAQSETSKSVKDEAIMDVSPSAVERVLREHGYPRLIHGHTHRPARHEHSVDGHRCERWVLGDWYERGSYLRCDAAGCEAIQLPG